MQKLLCPTTCHFPKVLEYRYLYECLFVLCCYVHFMVFVQCYVVDICMSVCLFGVVAYCIHFMTSWKMLLWLEMGKSRQ